MPDKLKKALIGALVAVGLAVAVSYGIISQQTADKIQADTNQALSDDKSGPSSPPQQPTPTAPAPQSPSPQGPATPGTAPQSPAPAPRQ